MMGKDRMRLWCPTLIDALGSHLGLSGVWATLVSLEGSVASSDLGHPAISSGIEKHASYRTDRICHLLLQFSLPLLSFLLSMFL